MKQEKSEKIYDAITDIRDDLVEGAEKKPRRRRWWPAAVAAVAAVAVLGGVLLRPGGSPLVPTAYAIAEAQYPEMAPYPERTPSSLEDFIDSSGNIDWEGYSDYQNACNQAYNQAYDAWWQDVYAQRSSAEYAGELEGFFTASIRQFLSGADGENKVYSPLNVYMALAMLAELTDGNSRQQILDLLGSEGIEDLRAQANGLWNANYIQDGVNFSVLASSLWLNEDVSFVQSTMDTLAETYYASSYRGEMGSDGFNKALQDWLNAQTGGLLEEQAGQIEMSADTILALAATIYLRAAWGNEFSKEATQPDVFRAPGGDVTCDFMHQSGSRTYYWGGKFSAVAQDMQNMGSMWFLLPDEGVSVDELLSDGEAMEFLLSNGEWENSKGLTVNLSVPKFDVTSSIELSEGLKALGVTDVFDGSVSDFSPMTEDTDEIFVSKIQHDARVVIDEEGCTAAAYTVVEMIGAAMPPDEEIDFVADRPFLFAITGADGLPLFVGVVNRPV